MRRLWFYILCLPVCAFLAPAPVVSPHAPTLARPEIGVEADAPWPDAATRERSAREEPLHLLRLCIQRYRREVRGFRAILVKQERVGGQVQAEEEIDVAFRDSPYSVFMNWRKGQRLVQRVLYVAGENDDQLLALPAGLGRLLGVMSRDPDSADARQSGRYSIRESGLLDGTLRTLRDWQAAADQGELQVEYFGIQNSRQAGQKPCYLLKRTCIKPEGDGITEVLIYLDVENGLQVGSVMTGAEGLIGSYFFREVHVNPDFSPDSFSRSALTR